MHTWDKLYLNLKETLREKSLIAQILWKLAHIEQHQMWKVQLLLLWRTEVYHTISLNKIMQQLGYSQIKISVKDTGEAVNFYEEIFKIIELKRFWLPILEKYKEETFGSDIYFTLSQIITDDTVNVELLADILLRSEDKNS